MLKNLFQQYYTTDYRLENYQSNQLLSFITVILYLHLFNMMCYLQYKSS